MENHMKSGTLFQSKNGDYEVIVKQFKSDTYQGVLVVEYKGQAIFSETVTVSYGAKFGVDGFDCQDWMKTFAWVMELHSLNLPIVRPIKEPAVLPNDSKGYSPPKLDNIATSVSYVRNNVTLFVVELPSVK